jgi:hypothetical protein
VDTVKKYVGYLEMAFLVKPVEKWTTSYSDFDWKDKRFDGVRLFLNRFPNVKNILLITKNVEVTTSVNNVAVHVVPLWKFLWSPQKNPVTVAFLPFPPINFLADDLNI